MMPIFDGHNDVLLRLRSGQRTFFERSDQGHLDLPRAREGGLGGGLFALFVPSEESSPGVTPQETRAIVADFRDQTTSPATPSVEEAQRVVLDLMARLFRIETESQGQVRIARTGAELARYLEEGIFAPVIHIEGAEAIDPELNALEVFYRAGLRSLGLVWSRPNAYGHGVPFKFPHSPDTGPGLTDAGKELVRECNRLGIMVDLSHLNERGFWDVAEISEAPLVASHSNAHSITPATRNLTDRQLDAIRESNGLVGVNFAVYFLRDDGEPDRDTTLNAIVRHIQYLVDRIGVDGVGLGSDFDGAAVPSQLGDAAGLPRLMQALRTAGYDEPALRKIAHENWLRVLTQTWGA